MYFLMFLAGSLTGFIVAILGVAAGMRGEEDEDDRS